jgi:hypothetical protein
MSNPKLILTHNEKHPSDSPLPSKLMDYAKAKNVDADEEATWDSCYDAPTDDEAEFPLAFKSDIDLMMWVM